MIVINFETKFATFSSSLGIHTRIHTIEFERKI